MRSTIKIECLSLAQWDYIHHNVAVDGRDFLPGMPRVCAVFELTVGMKEFHVEMDPIELAGLLVVLAGVDLQARARATAARAETPGKREDHPLCTLKSCPEHA